MSTFEHAGRVDQHRRKLKSRFRQLRIEQLEDRRFLSASPWTAVDAHSAIDASQLSYFRATDFSTYTLNVDALMPTVLGEPGRTALAEAVPQEIAIPNPDGGLDWFAFVEAPIMAPELAAEFPEIQTFHGQGITDPTATLAFDITPAGFHAQVLSPNGSYYIDPYYLLSDRLYAVYSAENTFVVPNFTECFGADCGCGDEKPAETDAVPTADCGCGGEKVLADNNPAAAEQAASDAAAVAPIELGKADSGSESTQSIALIDDAASDRLSLVSGTVLRTYRIAVAATGEYTAFHGGTVALGQSAIVTAINRVSGIYETELSIRLQLVANNSQLVYTNASTDPYTNDNPNSLLTQNQSNIDSKIGNANYDVGHVFSTGGGGLAALGVVGITGQKAQGETGLDAPIGDAFYVDYVAHELGHQFDGNHTFNGDSGSCSGANRNGPTAYEPGSGSTIMAYAGICGNDDLQPHSDPYFHSVSLDEIIAYVDNTIPLVGTRTSTGNSVPTVEAGPNYTIPAQTPFTLTATGSDANGDTLTYDWEERDLGPQRDLAAADNGTSPLFRSFNPTTSPTRTFPQLSDILNSTTTLGEKLPTLSRTMHFRVTARDNRAGGGGVSTDDMTVNVVNTGATFAITSPNSAVSWTGGSTQTVTWNVAGTTANGINTTLVNILLSTDGGNTFPTVLAANTPNDGSQQIVVPNVSTSTARIRVEAVGNIFFDISNVNFAITTPIPGSDVVGSSLAVTPANLVSAGGLATANFSVANQGNVAAGTFDVNFYFSDDATIDPATDLLLTLSPASASYDPAEPEAYHVPGVAGFSTHAASVQLAVPASDPFHTDNQYFIGMVVDADGDVTETDESNNRNRGDGIDRQSVFFSTAFANPGSISIPDSGAATPYPSTINVVGLAGTVADVNVSLFGLTHTFPDDLDILLVGPAGQKMVLMSDNGGGNDVNGVNLVFDDEAVGSLPNTSQITSGTFKPSNNGTGDTFPAPAPGTPYASTLATFDGTNPNGNWSLYVYDDSSNDTGTFSGGWTVTFTLSNTRPLNPINVTLPAISEDIPSAVNGGELVAAIVSASGATDPDGNQLGIAVTGVDNSYGQWQYSTNGGAGWQNLVAVSVTSARILGPTSLVRFEPEPDYNSSIAPSPKFSIKVWDQSSGTLGGTADTTVGTAFSTGAADVTNAVTPVNDPPNFSLTSGTVSSSEDAGAVTVNAFAANMVPGPASATDEAGQTLAFLVTVGMTTGTLAFDAAPAIDSLTGTLNFTQTANTFGTATVNVVLQDGGPGVAPNVNQSAAQQFVIDVAAVNDEQVLSINNVLTLDRGDSAQFGGAYLETSDIDDSPSEIVYTVTSGPSHGTLKISGNAVTQFTQQQINTGVLAYEHDGTATVADSFGFTVDDGEGAASSGTFQITIRPFAGDYNGDRNVDAADFVLWRKTLGTTGVVEYSGADGDGDTTIDDDDHAVWRANYGNSLPPLGAGSGTTALAFGALAIPASEPETSLHTGKMAATFETSAAAAQSSSVAVFDKSFCWQDSINWTPRQLFRPLVAASVDEDLLLLAVDRIGRFSRPSESLADDSGTDDHRTGDDQEAHRFIDKPLSVAFVEW